jgi:hypothetical protein
MLELGGWEVLRVTRQKRENEEWYLLILSGQSGPERCFFLTPQQRDDLSLALQMPPEIAPEGD